jgi:hypothetical protein
MKILKNISKFFVRHPVCGGLAIEAVLFLLFWIFPAGSCNSPLVGVIVLYTHYPALLFWGQVLGIPYSALQFYLSVILMAAVWIGLLFLLRRILKARLKSP